MREIVASLEDIEIVAKNITDRYNKHLVVLLRGDLAFGKTTLVKHIVKIYSKELVTSPTFSKMSIYGNDIFHYDAYRLDIGEFISTGLFENLDIDGLHLVEWGETQLEKLLIEHSINFVIVDIDMKEDNKRVYKIYA
jgi:tRNA threonylcarbamoyladenosine biosynthesis protein TsaE